MSKCVGLGAPGDYESRHSLERVTMCPSHWKEDGMAVGTRISPECNITLQRLPTTKLRMKVKFLAAGLSPSASHIYFLKEDLVQVYSLDVATGQTQDNLEFEYRPKDSRLCTAVISARHIVILMQQKGRGPSFHLFDLKGNSLGIEPFGLDADGHAWNPAALLALHESVEETFVAIGGSTKYDNILTGGIKIFAIAQSLRAGIWLKHSILSKHHKRNRNAPDLLKTLAFSPDGSKVVCSTSDNRILVWRLTARDDSDLVPFMIEREFVTVSHKRSISPTHTEAFAQDMQGGQISSVTIFTAPSSNPYLLCTTAPSRERVIKEGEWSFLSPVGSARDQVPNNLIHDLVRLGKCGPIIASAVSPDGRIIALIEGYKTNQARLLVLPVAPVTAGGLTAAEPVWLEKGTLSIRSSEAIAISPTAVRFIPGPTGKGFWLVAVDIEGKIISKFLEEGRIRNQILGRDRQALDCTTSTSSGPSVLGQRVYSDVGFGSDEIQSVSAENIFLNRTPDTNGRLDLTYSSSGIR